MLWMLMLCQLSSVKEVFCLPFPRTLLLPKPLPKAMLDPKRFCLFLIQLLSLSWWEETEDLLSTVSLGVDAPDLVIDVHDDVLAFCREYGPVTDSLEVIMGFSADHPASLPDVTKLMPKVRQWLLERTDDKAGFYTAQEDQFPLPPNQARYQVRPMPAPSRRRSAWPFCPFASRETGLQEPERTVPGSMNPRPMP